jgi:hypothetical protein
MKLIENPDFTPEVFISRFERFIDALGDQKIKLGEMPNRYICGSRNLFFWGTKRSCQFYHTTGTRLRICSLTEPNLVFMASWGEGTGQGCVSNPVFASFTLSAAKMVTEPSLDLDMPASYRKFSDLFSVSYLFRPTETGIETYRNATVFGGLEICDLNFSSDLCGRDVSRIAWKFLQQVVCGVED